MLSFNQVAVRRDGTLLFEDFSAVMHAGQKMGLTGANGTGKSTLFGLIRGELEADAGEVALQKQIVLAHVAQEAVASDRPALDYVIDGDRHLRELEAQMEAPEVIDDGVRHAEVLADFEQAGGYHAAARAGAMLNGLGFPTPQHRWPVSRFSGGWRMRLNLAQALMCPSDLLMLDEPTNHLDLDAVVWLEQWLVQREGGLILISHDRDFLDRVISHTLHIEQRRITLYTGNYSAFEKLRADRLANQQSAFEKQQQKKAAMQSFVDRFRAKATKARQAQSRLKMLERMADLSPAHVDSPFRFRFRTPAALPDPLAVLDRANIGYDGVPVLENVRLTVHAGDRIGLLGANGAGKSTLIKALVGELELLSGTRVPAQKLAVGYFAQHTVDQLRDDHSPLTALRALDPTITDGAARTYLGTFGFTGEQALQSACTLSGGERARLALSLVVYEKPNLLLLDEPTNHLDIGMRQALAEALQGFDGALMVVSHDRGLLRSVVDSLHLIADGSLSAFDDDLDGYARWLNARRAAASKIREKGSDTAPGLFSSADTSSSDAPSAALAVPVSTGDKRTAEPALDDKQRRRQQAARREQLRPLKKAVEREEKALEKRLVELSSVREKMGSSDLYCEQRKAELSGLLADEARFKQAVEEAEMGVLEAMQALEHAESAAR